MVRFLIAAVLALLVTAEASAQQCGRQGVFVFGADWCAPCHAVAHFLDVNHVPYKQIDVTNNERVAQFMKAKFGGGTIPVVVVDSNYHVGFNPTWMRNALCLK